MNICKFTGILILTAFMAMMSGCTRDKIARSRHFVDSGQRYFQEGKFDAAAIQFRRAIQSNPQSAEAYYRLGTADLQLHNFQEAYRSFIRATEIDPQHINALLQLAALKQLARQTDDSKMLLEKVIAIDPKNLDAHVLLGIASLQSRDYADALAKFKEAQEIAPNDAGVLVQEGDTYLFLKRYADAIASYEAAIQLKGTYMPAFMNLSQVYRMQNNSELEESTLQQAIERNPKEIAPYVSMAQAYLRGGAGDRIAPLFEELRHATDDSALAETAIADFYRTIGDSANAKTELQHILAKFPNNDAARMKLIEVEIGRQEFDDAEKLNQALLKLHPKNPQIRLYQARLLFVKGNKTEAISALQGLIHDVPEMALAHFYLGLAYAEQGQTERAIAGFNDAIRNNPDLLAAYVVLGELYDQQGDSKLALEFANRALARNPGLVSAILLQVNTMLQLGQVDEAQKRLLELAHSQPNNPILSERLGAVALKKMQLGEAETRFEEALKAQPDYVPAMTDLLQLYKLQKRNDKIAARLQQQIDLAPKQSKFSEMLGDVYLRNGDLKAAEAVMAKGLGSNPQDDTLKLQLSRVYAATNRLPLAIQTVQDVVQRHSTYSPGYVLLGALYEQSGSVPQAQEAYQKALQVDPNYAPALNNLAWLYCENGGNLDLALSMAQHAKESLPADPSVSDTLAWIEYKKGLYEPALQQLEDVTRQNPGKGLYEYHLGMTFLKTGNSSEAKQSLQRALAEDLSSNYIQSARAALAGLGKKSL